MTVFTNIGFMEIPMIYGIYGADALIYMTIFVIPFNILFYSYAIQTIQPEGEEKKKFHLRELMNVEMGACVISVIIYFSEIRLTYVLNTTLTAPLAMLAAIYNKDSFLTATEEISITTAVSVITMPLVAFFVGTVYRNDLINADDIHKLPQTNIITFERGSYSG